jgi:hypothetical protein
MLAHLLLAAAATLSAAAPSNDQGLMAYIVKQGSSRTVVSFYMMENVYEEPGDFVWARYDGVDYVVHDAATIEQFVKLQRSVPSFSEKKQETKRALRVAQHEREKFQTRSVSAPTEGERRAASDALKAADDKVHALERQLDKIEEEHSNARNAIVRKLALLVDSAIREGLAVRAQH